MCDPITLATTGLAIAGTAGSYISASQQASAQDRAYAENKRNAQSAFESTQATLTSRQIQEQDAASQQKMQMAQEKQRAQAATVNTVAASGTTGLSFASLLQDLDQQEAQRQSTADTNLDNTLSKIQAQKTAAGYNYVSQVNSVQRGTQPSLLQLGLGIASDGIGGYANFHNDELLRKAAAAGRR